MRESAEADGEAFFLPKQRHRSNIRQSKDEKMHTSRFGINVSGFENLLASSKPQKMEEQSESSGKLEPKKSEEPTWAKRVQSKVQKTGEFQTFKDESFEDRSKSKFRFIYPIEHLKELRKQKSPLRRSSSATALENLKKGKGRKELFKALD